MKVIDFGITEYREVLNLQHEFLAKRIRNEIQDTLLVVEHHPVVTLGKHAGPDGYIDQEYFIDRGIEVYASDRGGNNTYHAPGQILLYPVIDLREKRKSIKCYLDFLEESICGSLRELGVSAEIVPGTRGVWASGKKISFFGIAFKKWVSYHGVSINVKNDLEPFLHMHPCGFSDIKVTSVDLESDKVHDMCEVKRILINNFIRDFEEHYCMGIAHSAKSIAHGA